jgi:hypothetical protein
MTSVQTRVFGLKQTKVVKLADDATDDSGYASVIVDHDSSGVLQMFIKIMCVIQAVHFTEKRRLNSGCQSIATPVAKSLNITMHKVLFLPNKRGIYATTLKEAETMVEYCAKRVLLKKNSPLEGRPEAVLAKLKILQGDDEAAMKRLIIADGGDDMEMDEGGGVAAEEVEEGSGAGDENGSSDHLEISEAVLQFTMISDHSLQVCYHMHIKPFRDA